MLLQKSSKNFLKANHNAYYNGINTKKVVTKIVKELFESKSQLNNVRFHRFIRCYKNRQRTF